ncbi:MAG: maleylpyruvate isomerase N-terminal domain-containing protein [Streptosporangiaceae bacterium]
MHAADVRGAAEAALKFLEPLTGQDWSVPVPGLDFTVASVVAHAANGVLWYAIDYTTGPEDGAFDVTVLPDAEPAKLAISLRSAAELCATMIDTLPSTQRGFHPAGAADASGFAAMACDEILVHTRDAGTGLGAEFMPEPDLAGQVLARLFPWYEPAPDPWTALLHANGRIGLPGRSHQPERWRWHCAPLAQWDGTVPPAWPPA